jgi:hypothetical protein
MMLLIVAADHGVESHEVDEGHECSLRDPICFLFSVLWRRMTNELSRGSRPGDYKQHEKQLGQRGVEPGPEWVGPVGSGRPAQARLGQGFLPGCFLRDSLLVCTCMWAFDVISFMVMA